MRVQDHRKYHPRTSQFQDARRKLSTVSECTSAGLEKLDLESGLNLHDAEPECPICIGPLFVPNNTSAAGAGPMQAMPSQVSGGAVEVLEESGGRAGPIQHTTGGASDGRTTKPPASRWRASMWRLWEKSPAKTHTQASDDDILTLKACQHAFHAKCLSSWFLIGRYDCPVCRNHYWQSREERARTTSALSGLGRRPELEGGGGGPGIARPTPARLAVARSAVQVL
ncbi:hypothetical protein CT0861_10547 [Colletotrichum tofieldiae]|uniref:RING-type domain-containing protein n=1 Tax=Colletotrichum tofieldiae TaxID=708197 RepID=A0A166VIU3_9PEZI|nr:hypothetical protein CT0861_10547 [Colletotrichum tofieldiae]